MLQSEHFDALAAYLREQAIQQGFGVTRFQIGPVSLALTIAPRCSDLGLPLAFAPSPCVSGSESPGLTVFVIELSAGDVDDKLRPFLDNHTKTLQQLSSQSGAEQFVIKDNQRQTLKIFDQKNRIGLLAFTQRDLLPPWEFFSPVKEFIHLQALSQSCLLFHGASLVPPDQPDQGALVVGPGGSGKSTLTAYAIEQGMQTNGDDYVLVDLQHARPKCWSVYRTLKLHPTSPVLQRQNGWQTWKSDAFTGKSVVLADTVDQGGALLPQSTLSSVWGVSLSQSSAIHNPKAALNLSDPRRHPYLHSCMSTVQQMPYRIDATLALSRQLHQSIPYYAHTTGAGIEGLQQALHVIRGQ